MGQQSRAKAARRAKRVEKRATKAEGAAFRRLSREMAAEVDAMMAHGEVPFPCTKCGSMNRRFLPVDDPEAIETVASVAAMPQMKGARAVKCEDCGVVGALGGTTAFG